VDVEYPGFGTIVVEGVTYDHDVVIDAGRVRKRDKGPSRARRARYGHTPLTASEGIPWSGDRLVIGTGYSGRLPIADGVVAAAHDHGVELVAIPTADACTLLRDIEPARVNAVLHVTC
jgi:hypothetical protein